MADAPATNPFADTPEVGETESVSPDRVGERSAADQNAAEIERLLNSQGVPRGNDVLSPDRVGELSDAEQRAKPEQTDPEQIDRDQAEVDKRRQERFRAAGVDWEPPVRCKVAGCILNEFLDGAGLCGPHWALRPDLRPKDVRTTERKG